MDAPPKHLAHTILSKAHPQPTATAIFTEKVLHKPLHLRPTSPDPTSHDARAQRRLQRLRKQEHKLRHQKPKPLSAKEKRISGIYDIPKEQQKHEIYEPLHALWVGYMWEILGMSEGRKSHVTAQDAGAKLVSADYHGAEISVVRSRCVGMVGLKGIVVRDTKFTFQIVTKKDQLKTIPKRHTVFRVEIPQRTVSEQGNAVAGPESILAGSELEPLVFELYGSHFENRATDRATKKFKQRPIPDL